MTVPAIFDRAARRLRTVRSARAAADDAWLIARASEEIGIRLSALRLLPRTMLVMTPRPDLIADWLPDQAQIVAGAALLCDEDRLPFADRSFDCIVSIGLLDTVNDLPGALSLMRRALTPDGVLLAALGGGGSLPMLRQAMAAADPGRAHIHPQIDVRAMGDLMLRAGYAQPVVDEDRVEGRYRALAHLIRDLRANGQTNVLNGRAAMSRTALATLSAACVDKAVDGRFTESFVTLHVTGWASRAR